MLLLIVDNAVCSPDPHPVPNVLTGHQGLQVVSPQVVRWALIDLLRQSLQEAHWNISGGVKDFVYTLPGISSAWYSCALQDSAFWCQPAHEGQPLQHEGAGLLDAPGVRAPVLQAKVGEILENVQAFAGRDVPVSALLYFGEDPGLDESASEVDQPHIKSNI